VLDPFDPNTWEIEDREFRIYADDRAQLFAIVDEIDYHYLIQWRWTWIKNRNKIYLRRSVGRTNTSLYLHREVTHRAFGGPPTRYRKISDHLDGNSLNCQRINFRWATKRQNNQNRFGAHANG